MHGHAVVGEQGVQERAQNAPLWGASVEDQRGGDVVTYPHHLGMERKVTETSVAVAVTEKYLGLQYFTAEELKGVLNGSVLPLAWC